jgi:hypothetical protein
MSAPAPGVVPTATIRAAEATGPKGGLGAAKTAGELAGRFATLLQQMSGEDETTATASAASGAAMPREGRVPLSAVSLLALEPETTDAARASTATPSLAVEPSVDVRWAAKLFSDMTEAAE